LVPLAARLAEPEQDYQKMREMMIFTELPAFDHIIEGLAGNRSRD
jgi:hypothetical protein